VRGGALATAAALAALHAPPFALARPLLLRDLAEFFLPEELLLFLFAQTFLFR
jgi:hypothetical protein